MKYPCTQMYLFQAVSFFCLLFHVSCLLGISMESNGYSSDQIRRKGNKFLLCESVAWNCEEVTDLLCRFNYQVIFKSSPAEVIDVLFTEGHCIRAVLIVIDLPIIRQGITVLKYIMHFKEFKHIPVIMLSTQNEPALIHKCLKLGAADFLVRPLYVHRLLNFLGKDDTEPEHDEWAQKNGFLENEFNWVESYRSDHRSTRKPKTMLEGTGDNFFTCSTTNNVSPAIQIPGPKQQKRNLNLEYDKVSNSRGRLIKFL